jgi:hypothetical protein|tara:strand:- start:253 stop:732 length:480 start_codon:yes stop_codon:yes gene_type:complete
MSDEDAKIIQFPTNRITRPVERPDSKEDVQFKKRIEKEQTKKFIETTVDDLSLDLIRRFVSLAVKTNNVNFLKDLALLVDVMRGLLYRDFGLNHPAQRLIDKMVQVVPSNGQNAAKIDYSSVLEFKKKSSKPLNEDIQNELNDLYNGSDMFESDMDLDD